MAKKEKEITKISDLVPDANNYNKGTEFGQGLIEKSIRKNGLGRSLLIDRNGKVIAGNKTLEATVASGFDEDKIRVIKTDGTELIVVQRTDLDLDTRKGKEMALADNATSKANLAWDYEALGADFEATDLEAWGVFGEESAGGFGDNSLNSEAKEDDFLPPEIETVKTDIVLGDLFEIGPHRMLCGDSTKAEDVERLMGGAKADMVFTDPPYGIGIDGQKKSVAKNPKHNRKAHEFMGWDSERPDQSVFKYILSLNIPTVIFGGNYFADILPPSRCWIYWSKGQDGLTMSDGELAWTNLEKPLRAVTVNLANLGDTKHPTQKPVRVVSFCLDYTGEAKSVVDFFAGSGTTMVSCHKSDRRAYCLEISEKYCQIIIDRMLKLDPTLEIKKNGQPYTKKPQ